MSQIFHALLGWHEHCCRGNIVVEECSTILGSKQLKDPPKQFSDIIEQDKVDAFQARAGE